MVGCWEHLQCYYFLELHHNCQGLASQELCLMLRNKFSSIKLFNLSNNIKKKWIILQLKVCISLHSWFGLQVAMLVANPITISCTTIELSSEWTKVLLFLITSNSKSYNHAEAHSGTSTWSLDNVCFFIKVTQLSVLRYCENHTILFHWVCERAFQAKKVPSTNLNSHQKIGYHKYYTCQLALLRVICLKIKNVDRMHTRQFCMHNSQFKTTCSVTSEKRVIRLHCISPRYVCYRSNLISG